VILKFSTKGLAVEVEETANDIQGRPVNQHIAQPEFFYDLDGRFRFCKHSGVRLDGPCPAAAEGIGRRCHLPADL